jgi:carbamoyl-phosphate synthase large subunit
MNILLTSVGRRVELVRMFRQALAGKGRLIAADMERTAPALYFADQAVRVPACDDAQYVPTLLGLCRDEHVAALVPLIDPELTVLAKSRPAFAETGTRLLVAEAERIELCRDKFRTMQFIAGLGIAVPWSAVPPGTGEERACQSDAPNGGVCGLGGCSGPWPMPAVVKPRNGSAGRGVNVCRSADEVEFWLRRTPEPMVQELVSGEEVTTDVLSDLGGNPQVLVQRQRLKVRGGEVERGRTVSYPKVAEGVMRIAEVLQAPGVINVQCFLTSAGPVFTEINPRFGGGYPLAHAAGAAFPERIVEMLAGNDTPPAAGRTPAIRAGMVMMRFDEAVYRLEQELVK